MLWLERAVAKLQRRREERSRRRLISSLRAHLAFFGCDTSDLTDDQVEEGLLAAHRILARTGVTVDEAVAAMRAALAAVAEP